MADFIHILEQNTEYIPSTLLPELETSESSSASPFISSPQPLRHQGQYRSVFMLFLSPLWALIRPSFQIAASPEFPACTLCLLINPLNPIVLKSEVFTMASQKAPCSVPPPRFCICNTSHLHYLHSSVRQTSPQSFMSILNSPSLQEPLLTSLYLWTPTGPRPHTTQLLCPSLSPPGQDFGSLIFLPQTLYTKPTSDRCSMRIFWMHSWLVTFV